MGREKKKKFVESIEKAEVMGEKEWLWIPLVKAIFKVK